MTPQQQAMADILQVSLFKLAEEYHATLKRLKDKGVASDQDISELTVMVEQMVDDIMEEYLKNGSDFSMASVDLIHRKMTEAKRMAR